MTIDDLLKANPLVAFGEGDEDHGYAQTDNPEPAQRKLRHAFWKGATFAPVEGKPGCHVATLADKSQRVVFVK